MSLLELGPQHYHVWVHRGKALETCPHPAIRLEQSFMRVLLERMQKFKWKFGIQKVDGRVQFHGEKRIRKTCK